MAKKKTSKAKTETPAEEDRSAVAVAERPQLVEPFGSMAEWLDQWPTMFGMRMPDPMDRLERLMGTSDLLRVEEVTDGDDFVIRVEIPGVDPDRDIEISVDAGRLVVKARRERREETDEDGHRSEFRYGRFHRTMTLPAGVDADDVSATYTDGILEIRVSVDSAAEARTRVPITRTDD